MVFQEVPYNELFLCLYFSVWFVVYVSRLWNKRQVPHVYVHSVHEVRMFDNAQWQLESFILVC